MPTIEEQATVANKTLLQETKLAKMQGVLSRIAYKQAGFKKDMENLATEKALVENATTILEIGHIQDINGETR